MAAALSGDRPSSDLGAVHQVIALESDLGNAVERQAIPFGLCALLASGYGLRALPQARGGGPILLSCV